MHLSLLKSIQYTGSTLSILDSNIIIYSSNNTRNIIRHRKGYRHCFADKPIFLWSMYYVVYITTTYYAKETILFMYY